MPFTEHEQEFIDALTDELAAWGYSIHDVDDSTLRTILEDTASHPWGEREQVFLMWLDIQGVNRDGDLRPIEVKECLQNAMAYSELFLSHWAPEESSK